MLRNKAETQFQPTGFLKIVPDPKLQFMANSPYKIILPTDKSHDKSEDEYKVSIIYKALLPQAGLPNQYIRIASNPN